MGTRTYHSTAGMDVTCTPAYFRLRLACFEVSTFYHSCQVCLFHTGAAFKCNDGTKTEFILFCFNRPVVEGSGNFENKMAVAVLPSGRQTYGHMYSHVAVWIHANSSNMVHGSHRVRVGGSKQLWTLHRGGRFPNITVFLRFTPDELIRAFAARFPVCSLLAFGYCTSIYFEARKSLRWEVTRKVCGGLCEAALTVAERPSWASRCCAVC